MATMPPDCPSQKLGADICEYKNQQYLVIVDYYSRFIELVHLPGPTLLYRSAPPCFYLIHPTLLLLDPPLPDFS